MARGIRHFLLIVGLCLYLSVSLVRTAEAQYLNAENFVISNYGMNEGLPQSSVNDIIQSRDGYIWLATYGGLVRFDGSTFTTFNRSNTTGMKTDRIIKIFEDPEEGIWVFLESTAQEFLRCNGYHCESYRFPNEIAGINQMYTDGEDRLWLSAFGKVYRFENNEFIRVPVSEDPQLIERAREEVNGVWMMLGSRLLRTIGEQVVLVEDLDYRRAAGYIDVLEYPAGSGELLIGTNSHGIFKLTQEDFLPFNNSNGSVSNTFLIFKKYREDILFAIYAGTVGIWDGEAFIDFISIPWDTPIQHKTALIDTEGNYWLGTNANGLFKIRPSAITMIDGDEGITIESMLSIAPRSDGSALFSTNCGGVFEWDGERAVYSDLHTYFPSGCNWAVFEDSKERIWVGSNSLYMTTATNQEGIIYNADNGFFPTHIRGITEDSKQNIWIATTSGAVRFDGADFHIYNSENYGLSNNDVHYILEDSDGLMWFGTAQGLNVFKDHKISQIDLNVHDNHEYIQPTVRTIYQDDQGTVWAGTYGDGLFRFKNGKIQKVTEGDGLFDNIVSHIIEDESGNLWMGSNRGISRISKEQLEEYMDGDSDHFTAYSYGTSDGMNSAETNGAFQPNTFMDDNGNIYFPTVAGVAVVRTREINQNKVPPPVFIESIRSVDTVFSLKNILEIPYDTPFLEINYTAVNFTQPDKGEFRYKLEGLDEDWIDVGNRKTAMYSKIPPGNYTFRVIASNDAGVWNMEGASLAVIINPPFWMTGWFYSLMGILIGGIITSGYYIRIQKLKNENERKKRFAEQLIDSQEQERKRIARELHDGLGQQILAIKNRAELARQQLQDSEQIDIQLSEIVEGAMTSIGDVRNISHGLRPIHLEKFGLTEAIKELCEQLQESSSIEWSFHVDELGDVIPATKEINFYRVVQESVNNIIKHSKASEGSIVIQKNEHEVQAKIWDNGRGFDMKMREALSGIGFIGMQERVENMSGSLNVKSEYQKGTIITIQIPLQKHGKNF